MKVLIIKSSQPLSWYRDKIGEYFEVDKTIISNDISEFYQLTNDYRVIDILDCKTRTELRPDKFKRLIKNIV